MLDIQDTEETESSFTSQGSHSVMMEMQVRTSQGSPRVMMETQVRKPATGTTDKRLDGRMEERGRAPSGSPGWVWPWWMDL